MIPKMKKSGFTLIELIISLSILGIVTITIVPLVNSQYNLFNRQKTKAEMIYTCESIIEKLKAYDNNNVNNIRICEIELSYIFELFNLQEKVEIDLEDNSNDIKYLINIRKEEKSKELWILYVSVNHNNDKRGVDGVTYKAYIPKK